MNILTLSGWGQPYDALANIFPEANHMDYAEHNIDDALSAIAKSGKNHDAIIGWSLGGQLAVRAISAGLLKPKKLVLIATPFQFVHSHTSKIGMPRDTFNKFRDNYAKNSKRTLTKAWELIAIGDSKQQHIKEYMQSHNFESVLQKNWLYWLDELSDYSCDAIDFSNFPETLLIHGEQDSVVSTLNSQEFSRKIPNSRYVTLFNEQCGHAPHWHDREAVQTIIKEFCYV